MEETIVKLQAGLGENRRTAKIDRTFSTTMAPFLIVLNVVDLISSL